MALSSVSDRCVFFSKETGTLMASFALPLSSFWFERLFACAH